MTYEELKEICEKTELPCAAENDSGETVIIEAYRRSDETIYSVTTAQNNGWLMTHTYYADGTVEEEFKK